VVRDDPGDRADRQRIARIVERSKAPGWLRDVLAQVAAEVEAVPPIDGEPAEPKVIYRH
jgi:hypothetical protein